MDYKGLDEPYLNNNIASHHKMTEGRGGIDKIQSIDNIIESHSRISLGLPTRVPLTERG